jgi:hypothetical protein
MVGVGIEPALLFASYLQRICATCGEIHGSVLAQHRHGYFLDQVCNGPKNIQTVIFFNLTCL